MSERTSESKREAEHPLRETFPCACLTKAFPCNRREGRHCVDRDRPRVPGACDQGPVHDELYAQDVVNQTSAAHTHTQIRVGLEIPAEQRCPSTRRLTPPK